VTGAGDLPTQATPRSTGDLRAPATPERGRGRPGADDGPGAASAPRLGDRPRVLVLTTVLPSRRRLGGEIASQAFVDALAPLAASLIVIGYDRLDESRPLASWERRAGRRWIETAAAPRHVSAGWMLKAIVARRPYSVAKYASARYRALARRWLTDADLVVVDHAQSAWTLPFLGAVPTAYIAHNVESDAYASLARAATTASRRWRYEREQRLIARVERRAIATAGVVWSLTADDARWMRHAVPGADVRALGLPPPTLPGRGDERPAADVALLGTWIWGPNRVGLHWFLSEVVPALGGHLRIRIAGAVDDETRALAAGIAGHDVRTVGHVVDATVFLREARVVAIPTRAGTGVQVKALDAISAGVRIVATGLALRGVDDVPEYVELADEPSRFAGALARAIAAGGDPSDLQRHGRAWARERRATFEARVAESVAQLTGGR
jgi:polysaccharide biosynthesis protein PslH